MRTGADERSEIKALSDGCVDVDGRKNKKRGRRWEEAKGLFCHWRE
jgi:hypothetical protein